MERRNNTQPVRVETREDGKSVIVGYASVFYREGEAGTEYDLWDGVKERIGRGAFDRALKDKHDARGLFNHDPSLLLGRVGAGTVRLSLDTLGLRYEIDPPDTQLGRDLLTSLGRGDVAGSSFAFVVRKDLIVWGQDGQPDIRMVLDVDLLDVSPVTYPAYEATTAGVRCTAATDEARASYEAAKAKRMADLAEVERGVVDADLFGIFS